MGAWAHGGAGAWEAWEAWEREERGLAPRCLSPFLNRSMGARAVLSHGSHESHKSYSPNEHEHEYEYEHEVGPRSRSPALPSPRAPVRPCATGGLADG
jgi:hypothetical protein